MANELETRVISRLQTLRRITPAQIDSAGRAADAIRGEGQHADVITVLMGRELLSPDESDEVLAGIGSVPVFCPVCFKRFEVGRWQPKLKCPVDGFYVRPTLAPDSLPQPRPKPVPRVMPSVATRTVDALIGTRVDDYEIVGVVDDDNPQCRVFSVRHVNDDRPLVMKVSRSADSERARRFLRSGRYAALICHPNVVSVVAYGTNEDNLPYVVTESTGGQTLGTILKEAPGGKLEPREAVRILIAALRGLDASHRIGIVHRYVTPATIEVADGGVVCLTGYDLARMVDPEDESQAITLDGTSIGSPHFMPPEQFTSSKVDERADIYSAGATLYRALTGQTMFPGLAVVKLGTAKADKDAPRVTALAQVSSALSDVVATMLSRQPDARYPSAGHALQSLIHVPEAN